MDFFKQQAASFLDSQKDEEKPRNKKHSESSESGEYGEYESQQQGHSSSYGNEPTKQEQYKKPAAQGDNDDVPSYQELMSSANVLMGAAKAKFGGGGGEGKEQQQYGKKGETDPAKLAAAAQDVIDAAQHYGKFDDSSQIGSYLKKAEVYLHSYEKNPREAEAAVRDLSESRDSDDLPATRDSDEKERR